MIFTLFSSYDCCGCHVPQLFFVHNTVFEKGVTSGFGFGAVQYPTWVVSHGHGRSIIAVYIATSETVTASVISILCNAAITWSTLAPQHYVVWNMEKPTDQTLSDHSTFYVILLKRSTYTSLNITGTLTWKTTGLLSDYDISKSKALLWKWSQNVGFVLLIFFEDVDDASQNYHDLDAKCHMVIDAIGDFTNLLNFLILLSSLLPPQTQTQGFADNTIPDAIL